jgi:Lamin Tail Domain
MHVTRALIATLAAAVVAAVAADAAAGAIRITKIYYDSPGSDTGSNASRNAEWVRLKNTGQTKRNLDGWSIGDALGNAYFFRGYKLRAGRTVTIHTGRGTDSRAHRYWGSAGYIWDNGRDTARLRRPTGRIAHRCSYKDSGSARSVAC